MELSIYKDEDSYAVVHINGTRINNVVDYKISTSDCGETEVDIKIKIKAKSSKFELLTTEIADL